jgi:hypothetical protein
MQGVGSKAQLLQPAMIASSRHVTALTYTSASSFALMAVCTSAGNWVKRSCIQILHTM